MFVALGVHRGLRGVVLLAAGGTVQNSARGCFAHEGGGSGVSAKFWACQGQGGAALKVPSERRGIFHKCCRGPTASAVDQWEGKKACRRREES